MLRKGRAVTKATVPNETESTDGHSQPLQASRRECGGASQVLAPTGAAAWQHLSQKEDRAGVCGGGVGGSELALTSDLSRCVLTDSTFR